MHTVLEYRNEQILKMAMEDLGMNDPANLEVSFISRTNKALIFLNSKNINDYLNYKDSILKKILTFNFNFKPVYKMDNCIIERSQKNSNFYKLESVFEHPAEVLKAEFLKKYH